MSASRKIFISALDWGLGHVSRCIPVIDLLLQKGYEITLGGTGLSGKLLQNEFPDVEYIPMPGFTPVLSSGNSQVWALITNFPKLIFRSIHEHRFLKKLQKDRHFDIIISDHRYGVHTSETLNIMIIHQLRYKTPRFFRPLENISFAINRLLLTPFSQIWIPDNEGEFNFSGDLSHKIKLNSKFRYIGILSRFNNISRKYSIKKKHLLVLISGPEPQKSKLENLICNQLLNFSKQVIIVAGEPGEMTVKKISGNIIRYSHLPADHLYQLINEAELVISRSGYSTVMDLAALQTKALFIPTPGQSEQEYLAEYLSEQKYIYSKHQDLVDLNKDIDKALSMSGLSNYNYPSSLSEIVDVL